MLDRADCADFGCHNSIRLETKHFLNTLALTFISFSGRFVFAMQKHYLFFCERSSSYYYCLYGEKPILKKLVHFPGLNSQFAILFGAVSICDVITFPKSARDFLFYSTENIVNILLTIRLHFCRFGPAVCYAVWNTQYP